MYDQLAPYYDLIHAELTEDIPWVLSQAATGARSVLEPGCGTGRLLVPLARAGHHVLGVDNNLAMLRRCQARLASEVVAVRRRAGLAAGDMRRLPLTRAFDLIVLSHNTLQHFPDADLDGLLLGLRHRLSADGRLLLDLANPHLVAAGPLESALTLERVFEDAASGQQICQLARARLDAAGQILAVTWLFDATPLAGGAVHRQVVVMTYHLHYLHRLIEAMEKAGLQPVAIYGDYQSGQFTEESERLLIIGAHAS